MRGTTPTGQAPQLQPGQQQQQQHQHQQQHQGYQNGNGAAMAGRQRTTPTTPQFSPTATGAPSGIHDCLQQNGGKPLYLCQPCVNILVRIHARLSILCSCVLCSFVKAALVKGSFKTITAVPKYVDGMEWVAGNRE